MACSGDELLAPYTNTSNGADCDDSDPSKALGALTFIDLDDDGVGLGDSSFTCEGGNNLSVYGYDADDADNSKIVDEDQNGGFLIIVGG